MALIGNWDRNIITGEVHWSDEVYRIFGFKPKEFGVTYDLFLSRVHPDDREYVINAARQVLKGKSFGIDYRSDCSLLCCKKPGPKIDSKNRMET